MNSVKIPSSKISVLPSSVYVTAALNILCLQCSDHVWPAISSSPSVAFSPSPTFLLASINNVSVYFALIALISALSSANTLSLLNFRRSGSVVFMS